MNVRSQKKVAAKIMKIGLSRVKISNEKEVEDAITRNDVRGLIEKGLITKAPKKGPAKAESKKRREQKGKGRRKGHGSRKGKEFAKKKEKTRWMEKIRALRKLLMELRDTGKIERSDYRRLYMMTKGGFFRNKKHMLFYLKEKEILKKTEAKGEKK